MVSGDGSVVVGVSVVSLGVCAGVELEVNIMPAQSAKRMTVDKMCFFIRVSCLLLGTERGFRLNYSIWEKEKQYSKKKRGTPYGVPPEAYFL